MSIPYADSLVQSSLCFDVIVLVFQAARAEGTREWRAEVTKPNPLCYFFINKYSGAAMSCRMWAKAAKLAGMFGEFPAYDPITFSVDKGSIFGVKRTIWPRQKIVVEKSRNKRGRKFLLRVIMMVRAPIGPRRSTISCFGFGPCGQPLEVDKVRDVGPWITVDIKDDNWYKKETDENGKGRISSHLTVHCLNVGDLLPQLQTIFGASAKFPENLLTHGQLVSTFGFHTEFRHIVATWRPRPEYLPNG
jgi:hypothetical protein